MGSHGAQGGRRDRRSGGIQAVPEPAGGCRPWAAGAGAGLAGGGRWVSAGRRLGRLLYARSSDPAPTPAGCVHYDRRGLGLRLGGPPRRPALEGAAPRPTVVFSVGLRRAAFGPAALSTW